MLLRPATPLAVFFLVSFILLLLSTLSAPVVTSIPLATYEGYSIGVLGYCGPNGCSSPKVAYQSDDLPFNVAKAFSLSPDQRHSLSSLLIITPIAALLTLIAFGCAVAAHFHAPSHSQRFLLGLLVFTVPTLLATLLALLVDILLFVPHVAWGGWIVVGATLLNAAGLVITCALRRTLVGRKARKRDIAANPDMNGAVYYDTLAANSKAAHDIPPPQSTMTTLQYEYPRADSPPPIGNEMPSKGGFAAYEMQHQDGTRSADGDRRALLANGGGASIRSTSARRQPPSVHGDASFMAVGAARSLDEHGRPRRPSRDQYGNLIPGDTSYSELPPAPGLRHRGSQGSLGSDSSARRRRNGYGGPQDGMSSRGGYRGNRPPPGWRGRGRGYGPGPRGGRGGFNAGYGPPPRFGLPGPGYGDADGAAGFARSEPPPEYVMDSSYYNVAGGQDGRAPMLDEHATGNGPYGGAAMVPIGTAIEMDERTGAAPQSHRHDYALADHQPSREPTIAQVQPAMSDHLSRNQSPLSRHATNEESGTTVPASRVSVYSQEGYVPPRAQWEQSAGTPPPPPAPPFASNQSPRSYGTPATHARSPSGSYFEDVDPRFATNDPQLPSALQSSDVLPPPEQPTAYPHTLTPGGMAPGPYDQMQGDDGSGLTQSPNGSRLGHHHGGIDANLPYIQLPPANSPPPLLDQIPDGARSPADNSERMSEASHFTSISQRGINPNWQPGGGAGGAMSYAGGSSASAVQRRREDVILSANPDFSIPGVGAMRGARAPRGRPSPATRGGLGPMSAAGLTPLGRYPTDI